MELDERDATMYAATVTIREASEFVSKGRVEDEPGQTAWV